MGDEGVDRQRLHAWLAGRSIARGLPAPVPDQGGYRVETNSDAEVRRWVFPKVGSGLVSLGRAITEPRHFLKLCGDAEAFRSVLPDRWQIEASGYFMQGGAPQIRRPLPARYAIEINQTGAVTEVRIKCRAGELAASGYAAETQEAFVYDRIVTALEHRRKGLGAVVMTALHSAKRAADKPELLVATSDGRQLYESMGWRVLSTYSTASISDLW